MDVRNEMVHAPPPAEGVERRDMPGRGRQCAQAPRQQEEGTERQAQQDPAPYERGIQRKPPISGGETADRRPRHVSRAYFAMMNPLFRMPARIQRLIISSTTYLVGIACFLPQ